MAEVFIDNGFLLYLAETGKQNLPFWVKFFALADAIDKVQADEEDDLQCCFYDKDGQVLALQIHDPVDADGAPVEKALRFANQVLDKDAVYELVEESRMIKGSLGFTKEMSQQDFINVITDDSLTGEEIAEKFEEFDNVFFVGDEKSELQNNLNLKNGEQ